MYTRIQQSFLISFLPKSNTKSDHMYPSIWGWLTLHRFLKTPLFAFTSPLILKIMHNIPVGTMTETENKLTVLARGSNSNVMVYGNGAQRVVLKSVPSSARRQQGHLRQEHRMLSLLEHQNIIRALRYQERVSTLGNPMDKQSSTNNVLVLEYAPQGSLLEFLVKKKPGIKVKKGLFRDVATAVEYLHGRGIAHRDIKLENILVFEEENEEEEETEKEFCAKLSDFGFASRFLPEGEGKKEKLWFKEYKGTRKGYMAPEIHRCKTVQENQYQADRTDIFALGVVLFALMVGTLPFEMALEDDKLYRLVLEKRWDDFWRCHSQVQKLQGEINLQEFKELFQRMVSFDPLDRPSAKEIIKNWLL